MNLLKQTLQYDTISIKREPLTAMGGFFVFMRKAYKINYKKRLEADEKIITNGLRQSKLWKKKNKDKVTFYSKMDARKRRSLGKIDFKKWKEKIDNLKRQCQICFKTEPEIKLTMDHIISISKGGTNVLENLQPLCKKCNLMKSYF